MRIVPDEPTDEMLLAGQKGLEGSLATMLSGVSVVARYKAMLNAAPEPDLVEIIAAAIRDNEPYQIVGRMVRLACADLYDSDKRAYRDIAKAVLQVIKDA